MDDNKQVPPTVESVERSLQALALQPPGHATIPADLPPMQTPAEAIPLAALPRFAELICGYPPEAELAPVLYGVTMVRKLLSIEHSPPPIDAVIASGVCPHLVGLLQLREVHSQLHFEAAWALSNVLSGNTQHVSYLVSIGVAPALLQLLQSPHDKCRGQAVWGLGNIAGDGPEGRDHLVGLGIVESLQQAMCNAGNSAVTMGNVTWALLNVIRTKPYLPLDRVAGVGPLALSWLSTRMERELRENCAWLLAELTTMPGGVEMVLERGGLQAVAAILQVETTAEMLSAALTWFGNMTTTSNPSVTPMCVSLGCIASLARILALPGNIAGVSILKLVYWALSNLASGSVVAIQGIIDAGLVPTILEACAGSQVPMVVRKEAGWTFANLVAAANKDQARFLVDCGAFSVFSPFWQQMIHADVIVATLEGLDHLLQTGSVLKREFGLETDPFALAFEECGGLDTLEELQQHVSEHVYEKAVQIIETYFDANPE
jgi:hypothetical protein